MPSVASRISRYSAQEHVSPISEDEESRLPPRKRQTLPMKAPPPAPTKAAPHVVGPRYQLPGDMAHLIQQLAFI